MQPCSFSLSKDQNVYPILSDNYRIIIIKPDPFQASNEGSSLYIYQMQLNKQQFLSKRSLFSENKIHYQIQSQTLIFKPFHSSFVQEYHNLLINNPEIYYLTGSEMLSLEEQFLNQKSWLQDPKKYTFLIFTKQNVLIGDINLFFSDWIQQNQAQINIMIAKKQQRGKGYAQLTLKIIEQFVYLIYKKDQIIAKIKNDNIPSIKLFEKSQYVFVKENEKHNQRQYIKKISAKDLNKNVKMKQVTVD